MQDFDLIAEQLAASAFEAMAFRGEDFEDDDERAAAAVALLMRAAEVAAQGAPRLAGLVAFASEAMGDVVAELEPRGNA